MMALAYLVANVFVAVAIQEPLVIVFGTLVILLAVAFSTRSFNSASRAQATGRELLAATGAAFLIPALTGVVWIALFWAIYGVANLLDVPPRFWAMSISGVAALGSSPFFVYAAYDELAGLLYPNAVGAPSRLYFVRAQSERTFRTRVALFVVPPACLTLLLILGLAPIALSAAALVSLLIASACVVPAPESGEQTVAEEASGHTLAQAFADEGFEVITNPRTDRSAVDPFLAGVDLFTYRGPRAYLVAVRRGAAEGEIDEWTAAIQLTNAARSLVDDDLPTGVKAVQPLMVLVDCGAESAVDTLYWDFGLVTLQIDTHRSTATTARVRDTDQLVAVGNRYIALAGHGPSVTEASRSLAT